MDDYQEFLDDYVANRDREAVDVNTEYYKGDDLHSCKLEGRVPVVEGYKKLDLFRVFSAEINSEEFRVRTVKQQAEWVKTRAEAVRKLALLLLKIDSVAKELIDLCREDDCRYLFGVIKKSSTKANGNGSVGIVYTPHVKTEVQGLLEDYLLGDLVISFDEMAEKIIVDYNLSYTKFIQPIAKKYFAEYSRVKSIEEEYQRHREVKRNMLSLFDSPNSDEAKKLIKKYGADWRVIKNLMTTASALDAIITAEKNKLVNTNMRLCMSVTNRVYQEVGGDKNENFSRLDLINEGVIGLMKAVDMYVYGTDAKVTTYANWWIMHHITRYVKNNNAVRIPVHVYDKVNKILTVIREIENDRQHQSVCVEGREPDLRKLVESKIGPIKNSPWEVAMNRYHGISLSVKGASVSTEEEGCDMSFLDYLDKSSTAPEEDAVEDILEPSASSRIMEVAERLIVDCDKEDLPKNNISRLQYDLIYKQFVLEMSNKDIANSIGWEKPSDVREEIWRAIKRIRKALKDMGCDSSEALLEYSGNSRIMAIAEGMVVDTEKVPDGKLSRLQYDLIYKQFVKKMSSTEIARNIGWSDPTHVQKEISLGLKRIKERLTEMGW
ncbi:sigma factor [Alteromonas sp. 14N.309.X.WAT.G.H12]|uniref:sigma factor n=1 Tax=Alteromonas sp. 14N.309.X.WAT.G.H12 TaxID=3120824 RepID=UPI002FD2290A